MPSYDSDSSARDADNYTETSTLLGYASKEPTEDKFSQLGGHPTWLDDKTSPSARLAKCNICNGYLSLLLQLNGDLPDEFPGHERRLYLFTCRRKACRRKDGSIRAIRGNRITKSQISSAQEKPSKIEDGPAPRETPNIGNQLFGGTGPSSSSKANPFSTGSSSAASNPFSTTSNANPFANPSSTPASSTRDSSTASLSQTFAAKARISSSSQPTDSAFKAPQAPPPHEPWPAISSFPPSFPEFHLDADYETLDKPKEPVAPPINTTLEDAEMSGTSSGGGAEDKQLFESTMDTAFQKFADRLAQNPEQVLRYEYGSRPLLFSATDAVGKRLATETAGSNSHVTVAHSGQIPRCTNCGGNRAFELQLTPHAITVLEEEEMGLEGMEWGTILMGVCSKDCVPVGTGEGQVGYVEEWAGVQWEELMPNKK